MKVIRLNQKKIRCRTRSPGPDWLPPLARPDLKKRAGANENTTISFSDPVKINGRKLPAPAEFVERLEYRFIDPTENSVQVSLHWEKRMVSFKVEVDVHASVVNNMRKELRSLPRFSWRGWYDAANYCHKNNVFPEQAKKWIDHSISMTPNFTNFNLKSEIQRQKGNKAEADKLKNFLSKID